jgi:ADP-L-glycero-D-manno-heptose 6-epimerase
MIIVTGAAGFIGSNVVKDLRDRNVPVAVCDWNCRGSPNLESSKQAGVFDAEMAPPQLFPFIDQNKDHITAIIHMGAISSTTEHDKSKLMENNTRLTVNLWLWCAQNQKRLIYASSASVYGKGSTYWDSDNPDDMKDLEPLNDYGWSKLTSDMAIATLARTNWISPPQWVGLRFFNVYGPNEWHKSKQASLITKSYGKPVIELFDIEATRDFVYVKDCTKYITRCLDAPKVNGLFNIGTEYARPFEDIARILGSDVARIPMPDALKGQYQFHTKAVMNKAKYRGLWFPPTSLEDGIADYVEHHLLGERSYR